MDVNLMKRLVNLSLIAGIFGCMTAMQANDVAGQLTDSEKAAGWVSLFDGTSTDAWRSYRKDNVDPCWQIKNGVLTLGEKVKRKRGGGG